MKQITIIGAGAAGLMTAATILENTESESCHIHIFEKNKTPGNKVIISGGGRCNLTTGIEDKKILLSKYTRGADFIRKAFGKFSPRKCREWFESHGVPLKCEKDNRVFPVSDDGYDIVEVFEKLFAKYRNRITLHYGEGVDSILSGNSAFQITTKKGTYDSDIVVITTGGNAYSHTGSTGDGYAFARSLGHTVTQLGPSLSSFLTSEKWTHELSGLAFESAKIGDLQGPLLLTHFGISGPLAFMTSSGFAWETIDKNHPKIVHFSPISTMGYIEWEAFLKEQFANHPKKLIISILTEKLPRRFAEAFIREYFTSIETIYPVSIGKVIRENISKLLGEGIPLTLTDRRPGDEFVTAGGVNTDEIDAETMESKIQKNLYFAGEVLNVDGFTGGFSLQICWASGYVAGRDIGSKL
ncbi:aminoacetone oxidase family FAD-binding enzyme [Candidatus Gracilibacteria bacterium]|nr:aminoacetone oxidase family FAD-binding enzyme [Candidatus Gracilibacteria bacterium]